MLKFWGRRSQGIQRPQFSVYKDCSELPLWNFIEIVVTGDLKHLQISGECPNLPEVWEQIHNEYAEISQNLSSVHGLNTAIDIVYYTEKLRITHLCVNHLLLKRSEILIDILRDNGFNYKFNDLDGDLKRVITRSKTDELQLSQAKLKYDNLQLTNKSTRLEWRQRLSQLAKFQGVSHINSALISVIDFVALEKEFKQFIEASKQNGR